MGLSSNMEKSPRRRGIARHNYLADAYFGVLPWRTSKDSIHARRKIRALVIRAPVAAGARNGAAAMALRRTASGTNPGTGGSPLVSKTGGLLVGREPLGSIPRGSSLNVKFAPSDHDSAIQILKRQAAHPVARIKRQARRRRGGSGAGSAAQGWRRGREGAVVPHPIHCNAATGCRRGMRFELSVT